MSRLNRGLWQLSVQTTPQAEEAVSEAVTRITRVPATAYTHADTGKVTVSVYLKPNPRHLIPAVRAALARIQRCGLPTAPSTVTCHRLPLENWAESWKRHFKPLVITNKLLVKPGWSRRQARPGQKTVVLDPGLSFGTGHHPTTSFCLHQLVSRRRPGHQQSFLDAGSGSGILAIAAAMLGYSPIDAFDADPEAVRIAKANARQNGVRSKMRICGDTLNRFSKRCARRYDLICANLLAPVLLTARARLLERLKPRGILVLSGILRIEFADVQAAYEKAGLQLATSIAENEWQSGAFIRRKPENAADETTCASPDRRPKRRK